MSHRLFFHTFGEESLVQGFQCSNDWMLQESRWLVLPLHLFCGEFGYPLGSGGVLLGVPQCRVLELRSGI